MKRIILFITTFDNEVVNDDNDIVNNVIDNDNGVVSNDALTLGCVWLIKAKK